MREVRVSASPGLDGGGLGCLIRSGEPVALSESENEVFAIRTDWQLGADCARRCLLVTGQQALAQTLAHDGRPNVEHVHVAAVFALDRDAASSRLGAADRALVRLYVTAVLGRSQRQTDTGISSVV